MDSVRTGESGVLTMPEVAWDRAKAVSVVIAPWQRRGPSADLRLMRLHRPTDHSPSCDMGGLCRRVLKSVQTCTENDNDTAKV